MAWVARRGSNWHDHLKSDERNDKLLGLNGNDFLFDGSRYGQQDSDMYDGGGGRDTLRSHWGIDVLRGDLGNDLLVSRSDAGEPAIAHMPGMAKIYPNEPALLSNDTMNGGLGGDEFLFRLDLNASLSVLAEHADMSGDIDWAAVVGDGETPHHPASAAMAMADPHSPHHHWIEGIGFDTIKDFYRDEGDRIVIQGYSVAATITYGDSNHDGRDDVSIIRLSSDQGGTGPHHGDQLGVIRVYGDLVTTADLVIDNAVHHGAFDSLNDLIGWTSTVATAGDDVLRRSSRNDSVAGLAGDDTIIDGGQRRDRDHDTLDGGDGNDIIRSRWGNDVLKGGDGDDILVSRSDAGEPDIFQRTLVKKYYPFEPYLWSSDVMSGGLGADTFFFRLDLNARPKIAAKHSDDEGYIDWHRVAGENDSAHLHWVDAIGNDTILDFYRAEGDKIVIEGHTVRALINYADTDGDRRDDTSFITLRSNQGGSGSHHRDILGTIRVTGNLVTYDDLEIDAGVHHGASGTLEEYSIA